MSPDFKADVCIYQSVSMHSLDKASQKSVKEVQHYMLQILAQAQCVYEEDGGESSHAKALEV